MKKAMKRNMSFLLSFVMMVTFATFSFSVEAAAKTQAKATAAPVEDIYVTVTGDTVFTLGPFAVAVPDGWELFEGTDEEEYSYYMIGEETQGMLHVFVGLIDAREAIEERFIEMVLDPMFPDGIEVDEIEDDDDEENYEMVLELENGLILTMSSGTGVASGTTLSLLTYTLEDEDVYFTMFYMIPEDVMANSDPEEIVAALLSLQIIE